MLDEVEVDGDAGVSISQALVSTCMPAPTLAFGTQYDAGGVLGELTGEPLQLNELLIMGGGSFRQRAIGWLEQNGFTPVVDLSTMSEYRYVQRDGGLITEGPVSNLGGLHDIFMVQLVRAPSGALVLNAAGYYAAGTAAAAWYVVNDLLPRYQMLTETWFVLDWVDTNANGLPDAADAFTLIGSGH